MENTEAFTPCEQIQGLCFVDVLLKLFVTDEIPSTYSIKKVTDALLMQKGLCLAGNSHFHMVL